MGKTSITLLGLLFLAISGMAQPIPAPATTSQATNLVAQDSYMSPARVGDFWYDVVIPFVLSNGGGTIASNSIAKNNGVGTNLTIYGTLTSTNFDSKIKSATNGVLVTASNIFSIKGSAGGVVPAPATTSQATNLVTQDVYMSPARVGDFWNYVGIPFVLANGGSGGGSGSGSGTGVYSIFGILTNAGTFTGTFIGTFTNSGYYGNGFGLTNLQSTNIIGLVAGSGIATSNGFGTNLTVYGTFTSTNITAAIKAATNNLVIPSTNGLATTNYVNTATNNLGNSVAVNMTNAANQFTGKFTNGTYYGNGAGLTNVAGTGGTTNVSFPNIIITTNYPYEILAGGNNSTSIFYIHPFTNAFNGSFRAQYTENGGGIEWLTNIGGMFCFFTTAYSSTIPYVTNTGGFVSTNWIFNGTPLGSTAYTYYASNGVVSYSLIITNGTYYGNGGGLTNLQSTNIIGLVVGSGLTNTQTGVTLSGTFTNSAFYGNGGGLTNLNGTNLVGTLTNNTLGNAVTATTATTAGTATNSPLGLFGSAATNSASAFDTNNAGIAAALTATNNFGNTIAATMTNANNVFYGNGSNLTGISSGATNAIANLNGFGTNTTLMTTNAYTYTTNTTYTTNSLYSTNLLVANADGYLYPDVTGFYNQSTNYGALPTFTNSTKSFILYHLGLYWMVATNIYDNDYFANSTNYIGTYLAHGATVGTLGVSYYSTTTNSPVTTNYSTTTNITFTTNFSPTNGGTFIGTFAGDGSGLTNVTATNGWPVQWTWASITNQPTLGTAAAASTNQFLAAGAGGVYDGIGVTNLNVTNITGQTFYLQTALIMENDFNASYPPFNGPQFYIPKGGAGNDQINLLLPPISWWGWNGKTNLVLTSTFACTNRAIAEFNLNWQFISSNGIPSSSTTNGYWITNTVANTNVMSIVLTQAVKSSTISISFGHYYIANSATNSIWWIGGTVTAQ
jgi:hypothetical protein